MTLDEFMEEFNWLRNTWHQEMYVNISGKEYRITGAYPESDAIVDPDNPDLREEERFRLVFEVNYD